MVTEGLKLVDGPHNAPCSLTRGSRTAVNLLLSCLRYVTCYKRGDSAGGGRLIAPVVTWRTDWRSRDHVAS